MSNWLDTGALFSPDRHYRYRLWRTWEEGVKVGFLMLNPSTADELVNDPTVERCEQRARKWGYSGFIVTNLFGYRATDPGALKKVEDPVGPDNDAAILQAARDVGVTVCAWGNHGKLKRRSQAVVQLLHDCPTLAFRLTGSHEPMHPLYIPYNLDPTPWPDGKPQWNPPTVHDALAMADDLLGSISDDLKHGG